MSGQTARPGDVSRRHIGPIGTAARLLGGAVTIAVPIALDGFSWLEAVIALIALPFIAAVAAPLVTALYGRLFPNLLRMRHAICSPLGCMLIAVMAGANVAVVAPTSANGNVTIWVWLGRAARAYPYGRRTP